MKQFVRVSNIPIVKDGPWDYALAQIQKPFFRLGKFDEATEVLIIELQSEWATILHWLIKKKWRKKHKIPGNRATNKCYEPLGELYYRILELCLEVHSYNPCGYYTAADWFSSILAHQRNETYNGIFAVASGARETPTKTEVTDYLAKTAATLKDFRNPYNPGEDPQMYALIRESIAYAESSDIIREGCWKDFTDAYSNWSWVFSGPDWFIRYAKNGNLYRTSGKGRNRGITVEVPPEFMQSVVEEAKRVSSARRNVK